MNKNDDLKMKRLMRRKKERLRRIKVSVAVICTVFVGVGTVYFAARALDSSNQDTAVRNEVSSEESISADNDSSGSDISEETVFSDESEASDVSYTDSALPPAAENNDLLDIATTRSDDKKIAYLTFDDGPTTSVTPLILDTLRRFNVKATFFEVGSLIEKNPDMARRVYEEGHLIANHSYSHTYSELYESSESFMSEINQTYEAIRQVTGEDAPFKLVRFPGGSFNSGTYGEVKQEYKALLAENGYYYCDWNSMNADAEGGSKTAEQLTEYLKTSVKGRSRVVILMHDAATKHSTAEALDDIILYLTDEGYEFRRLDQAAD